MEEQNEDILPIYNVTVGDTKTKAIDIIALRQWFMLKESQASIINVNILKLKETSIAELQAGILQEIIMELRNLLDDSLGLNQPESEEGSQDIPQVQPLPQESVPLEEVPETNPQADPAKQHIKPVVQEPVAPKAKPAPEADFIEQPNNIPPDDDDKMIEL